MFAELAIYVQFFGREFSEHLVIAAAVGFGDESAKFALAAFELAMLKRVKSVFNLLGHGLRV